MMKRVALLGLTVVFFALACITEGTFAWFSDTTSTAKIFQIGDIQYRYSDSFFTDEDDPGDEDVPRLVVPGQTLTFTQMELTNQSNIDTHLRIQIQYSYDDETMAAPVILGGNDDRGYLEIALSSQWDFFSGTDDEGHIENCYRYRYDDSQADPYFVPAADPEEPEQVIEVLESLRFTDAIKSELSGSDFTITVIFQAKQANFVSWETLGTLSYTVTSAP